MRKSIFMASLVVIALSSCGYNYTAREITESERAELVAMAASFIGAPYVFGGDNKNGIDCSGLVVASLPSYSFLYLGDDEYSDDANAHELFKYNTVDIPEPKTGDLMFWVNEDGRAYHVAIALPEGKIIDAYSVTGVVDIREIGIPPTHFGRLLITEISI